MADFGARPPLFSDEDEVDATSSGSVQESQSLRDMLSNDTKKGIEAFDTMFSFFLA